MNDSIVATLRSNYQAIANKLETLGTGDEREAVKREIVTLFKTVDQSITDLSALKHEDYDDALATFQKVLMKEPANSLARINVGYICLKKRIFGEAIEHLSKAIRPANDKKATLYAHYYLGLVYSEREMHEDAQTFFRKTLKLGPNLIEAYYELGWSEWYAADRDAAQKTWADGYAANKFTPWGKRCKEALETIEQGQEPRHF